MAWVRMGFCGLGLAGFQLTSSTVVLATTVQIVLELGTAISAVLFSIWVLRTTRRHVLAGPVHLLSVSFDAALATVALATNWFASTLEGAGYDGALSSLDIAILPILVMTSVLRLSQGAVLASVIATSAGLAVIVGFDHQLGYSVRLDKLVLLGVYQLGASAAAWIFTRWFVATLHGTSSASVRAERARSGLLALLTDHHDLRSSISDVRMNAERLHEELTLPDGPLRRQERALSENVTQGLVRMTELLHTTGDRVLRVLDGSGDLQSTHVERGARAAIEAFRALWPAIPVELRCERDIPAVLFGGDEALAKLITNLLVNAAEGDPEGGATRISIEAELAGAGCLNLTITDDGPGFSKAHFDRLGQRGFSTKPRSSGLGLWLAESAVVAAGGRLQLVSHPKGASVRVSLRTLG